MAGDTGQMTIEQAIAAYARAENRRVELESELAQEREQRITLTKKSTTMLPTNIQIQIRDLFQSIKQGVPDSSSLTPVVPNPKWSLVSLVSGQHYGSRLFNDAPADTMLLNGLLPGSTETLTNFSVDSCIFTGEVDKVLWGARLYNVVSGYFSNCLFTKLGEEATWNNEGHGVYANVLGGLGVYGCFFDHIGGQGLQLVNRDSETGVGYTLTPTDAIDIDRCVFRDCSMMEGRGAFPLSVFNPGAPVNVEDTIIMVSGKFPTFEQGGTFRSRGGALFGDSRDGNRCPKLTIRDLAIILDRPFQPHLLLEGQDEVDINGLALEDLSGVPAVVMIDENCRSISIRNIYGDVDIYQRSLGGPPVLMEEIRGRGKYRANYGA